MHLFEDLNLHNLQSLNLAYRDVAFPTIGNATWIWFLRNRIIDLDSGSWKHGTSHLVILKNEQWIALLHKKINKPRKHFPAPFRRNTREREF